ncbi:hypothetical protein [Aureispira sp. CCB-E]|uniref:hypothetical protein n=1 Tax=Aureispira sp. CCB-E TaxID=3051121 RepID=UPI002868D804|nr:hypothetical protein [Aureispira sp. CCB-E]WMX13566.1 hypothetical protein QP953_22200 [Aureispira sp. CCB-E]
MKNTLYIILTALLFGACGDSTNSINTEKKTEAVKSTLEFQIDYKDWNFETPRTYEDFKELLDKKGAIRLDNILIKQEGNDLYDFNQNLGDVLITKNSPNDYTILEHYIIPIGSVYGKSAIFKYTMDPEKGTIIRDKDFVPQLTIYKYWSNHIVKEYDSYLNDTSFTTNNIEAVPYRAFENMRFLMFNLALATVLEDCQACEERLNRIETDYSFVSSKAYFKQNLFVCKTILRKFKM